ICLEVCQQSEPVFPPVFFSISGTIKQDILLLALSQMRFPSSNFSIGVFPQLKSFCENTADV
ncbi:hypothetical protein, partial [Gallibacterium anatis]|uniref:hypothetical protein n=1 Tax=Gallibacterium anatis TaxID=750 RepID=UPI003AAFA093